MIGKIAKKEGGNAKEQLSILHKYWDLNKTYTLTTYFELEEKAPFKSEFANGKIIPMSGGSIPHNRIKSLIHFYLWLQVMTAKLDAEVFDSDQKIFIPSYNRNVYSDACIVEGAIEKYQEGNQAITNPTVVVEVLSKSTGYYDRGAKFIKYKTIPSFKEYILVNQDMPIVDVFFKKGENDWQLKTYIGLDQTVQLQSLNIQFSLADIYKNVDNLKDPQIAIEFPED